MFSFLPDQISDLVRVMVSVGGEIYPAFPEIFGDHYENPSRGLQEGLE